MDESAVGELQVPPRRFWCRVGSETVAEGIQWNSHRITLHCPGHPTHAIAQFDSMAELTEHMIKWGWGDAVRIDWIDDALECVGAGE